MYQADLYQKIYLFWVNGYLFDFLSDTIVLDMGLSYQTSIESKQHAGRWWMSPEMQSQLQQKEKWEPDYLLH